MPNYCALSAVFCWPRWFQSAFSTSSLHLLWIKTWRALCSSCSEKNPLIRLLWMQGRAGWAGCLPSTGIIHLWCKPSEKTGLQNRGWGGPSQRLWRVEFDLGELKFPYPVGTKGWWGKGRAALRLCDNWCHMQSLAPIAPALSLGSLVDWLFLDEGKWADGPQCHKPL